MCCYLVVKRKKKKQLMLKSETIVSLGKLAIARFFTVQYSFFLLGIGIQQVNGNNETARAQARHYFVVLSHCCWRRR
jgi:hypothetical protein